jgi:predicted RNase H-like HicB family nuclease
MKNLKITIEFWREGKLYIANCPELDILAQGYSLDEARKNLHEVIEIHFEEMKRLGTLDQFLEDMGYKLQDDIIMSNSCRMGSWFLFTISHPQFGSAIHVML